MFNTLAAEGKYFVVTFSSRVTHTGETSPVHTTYVDGVDPAALMLLLTLKTSNTVYTLLCVQEISRELFEVAEANYSRARGYDVVSYAALTDDGDWGAEYETPMIDDSWHGTLS